MYIPNCLDNLSNILTVWHTGTNCVIATRFLFSNEITFTVRCGVHSICAISEDMIHVFLCFRILRLFQQNLPCQPASTLNIYCEDSKCARAHSIELYILSNIKQDIQISNFSTYVITHSLVLQNRLKLRTLNILFGI